MKKELLVCTFSGGRTSAFMALFISQLPKYKDNYDIVFIFCNTGKERPETLKFVKDCQDNWGIEIVWLEAKINQGRVGTSFNIVDFETASRNGEPFEAMLEKYPIPNMYASNCTRELKMRPIEKYISFLGYDNYTKAMGIRKDEEHRRSVNAKKDNIIYPLMDDIQVDSSFIRNWWDRQNFDLKLKDYQGNCDLCFKKSLRKKLTIIKEDPDSAEWWSNMEKKFGTESVPRFELAINGKKGHTIEELVELAKKPFQTVHDVHEISLTQNTLFDLDLDSESDCYCKAT